MIDWTKPIQTRDGRKARYIGELRHSKWTRIVATDDLQSGNEHVSTHTEDGRYAENGQCSADIINAPAVDPWIEAAAKECAGSVPCWAYKPACVEKFIEVIAKHAKHAKGAV